MTDVSTAIPPTIQSDRLLPPNGGAAQAEIRTDAPQGRKPRSDRGKPHRKKAENIVPGPGASRPAQITLTLTAVQFGYVQMTHDVSKKVIDEALGRIQASVVAVAREHGVEDISGYTPKLYLSPEGKNTLELNADVAGA